ncbi:hypothetical protein [Gilvibacter sp.]|uniref:hypothetical protein n=1 Tax=Gilvibacter sp. TaxID=2729997 RepID=UPI0025BA2A20|nr:hypothetical protein [Gilvibacter sp.]NQX77628.1 hypothetical protein [Gilvibacter sp.]
MTRKILATVFMGIALVFGVLFYSKIQFPVSLEAYLQKSFYSQFGPIAICVELLNGGYNLFVKHKKSNFTLALFGFTALLDPIFNTVGLFTSNVPTHAMVVFVLCAFVALWLAFSNTFKMGRISLLGVILSFILGLAVELFFNYL